MIDRVILDHEHKRFWLAIIVLGLAALLLFKVYSAPEQSVPVPTADQAPAARTAPEALAMVSVECCREIEKDGSSSIQCRTFKRKDCPSTGGWYEK